MLKQTFIGMITWQDIKMRTASILLASALLCISSTQAHAETGSRLPMNQVYRGTIHLPDFNGRDSQYARFKTKITNEMKTGPNFAGHYAIVTVGCGTSCNFSFVGDVATGQVFSFPYGGEEYYMLQLRYGVKDNSVSVKWVKTKYVILHNLNSQIKVGFFPPKQNFDLVFVFV